jgi:hypothetical protein
VLSTDSHSHAKRGEAYITCIGKRDRVGLDVQLVYHLPRSQRHPHGLEVRVPRSFDEFMDILVDKFPHEEEGIRAFYGECWTVRSVSLFCSFNEFILFIIFID